MTDIIMIKMPIKDVSRLSKISILVLIILNIIAISFLSGCEACIACDSCEGCCCGCCGGEEDSDSDSECGDAEDVECTTLGCGECQEGYKCVPTENCVPLAPGQLCMVQGDSYCNDDGMMCTGKLACRQAVMHEVCGNGIDEDCAGGVDCGLDSHGQMTCCDDDGDLEIDAGFAGGLDCDDDRADVCSTCEELCDPIDHDCDGNVNNVPDIPCEYSPTQSGVRTCQAPALNPASDSYWSECTVEI